MSNRIFLDAPNIGAIEKKYLNKAIDSGYVSTVGPLVGEFEERFAKYLQLKKAVSTQSGTAAIHVALHELGIGKGDEVIVPVLTFIATVNPVVQVGATPVFVDIDPETWNIDPREVEKKITKKTKAIIPVHLYGNPCDMKELVRISKKYGVAIIEDATESLGASFGGRPTGTFGEFGCFSFNGNKVITTGGGGMIIGKSLKKLEHAKFLVNQARDESRGYFHPEVGFNYRMTNIEAALGLAQIGRLEGFLKTKAAFNRIYRQELSAVDSIRFQKRYQGSDASWWLTCVSFDRKINVASLQRKLKDKGIPARRLFMPITMFPPYKQYLKGAFKNAYDIYKRGLCLPSSTLNSVESIKYVCGCIKALLNQ
ncbi:MAG: aminotransferase class V-fold PLP-dependent enzyme [Elusimicrobia bacterium]|nr:aminotransferase class V-fold PLP-dependent enzyme [Elusimicrobiota bacterium]